MSNEANKITGAKGDGASGLRIPAHGAARIAQFLVFGMRMNAGHKVRLAIIVAVTVGMVAAVAAIWFPLDPLYLCQKVLHGGLEQWKLKARTNVWPNVDGVSANLLLSLNGISAPRITMPIR